MKLLLLMLLLLHLKVRLSNCHLLVVCLLLSILVGNSLESLDMLLLQHLLLSQGNRHGWVGPDELGKHRKFDGGIEDGIDLSNDRHVGTEFDEIFTMQ